MLLSDYTIEELREEMKRREKIENEKPQRLLDIDFKPLIDYAQIVVDTSHKLRYFNSNGYKSFFEFAMKTMYGDKFFNWWYHNINDKC